MRRLLRFVGLVNLFVALAACAGAGLLPASSRPATPSATLNLTTTATPLRPLPPTPTYLPSVTPTLTPTPTPTSTPTPLPPGPPAQAVPPITELDGRVNLVLLGSDRRPYHTDFRTDTIVFVSFDPKTGQTLMASFPRDLYVRLPGYGVNRINTAMELGGFPLLAETLAFNFGVRPQHYILINFRGFKALVAALGGIDVYVPRRLCDHLRCVGPGQVHMDAETALWYVRSRETTSDFDRAWRQQAVLRAIAERLLRFDALHRAPQLYTLFRNMVVTDLGAGDVVKIVAQAGRFSPDKIQSVVFAPPQFGTPWITPQGAYVVLPNIGAIQAKIRAMVR